MSRQLKKHESEEDVSEEEFKASKKAAPKPKKTLKTEKTEKSAGTVKAKRDKTKYTKNKKNSTKEESDRESGEEDDQESKTSKTSKTNKTESKPTETVSNEWGGMCDDYDDDLHSDHDSENDLETGNVETAKQVNADGSKNGVKYTTNLSIINFDYTEYLNLKTPVSELSSNDLLKVLIARTHSERQYVLCKTLKQTLKAKNSECNYPGTRFDKFDASYDRHVKPTRKPDLFAPESHTELDTTMMNTKPPATYNMYRGGGSGGFRGRNDKYSGRGGGRGRGKHRYEQTNREF